MWANVTVAAVFGLAALTSFAGAYHGSRLRQPDARTGLRALLVIVGCWALLQALQMLTTDRALATALFTVGLVVGFGTVFAWLYFCSAYTGRTYHRQRRFWVGAITLYATLTAVKLTNPLHGQYFTATMASEPYTRLVIEQGTFYWASFLLAYALTAIGMYFLLELFVEAEQPTATLQLLVAVTALPIVPKLLSGLYPTLVPELSYEPVGVAIFALGTLYFVQGTFTDLEVPTRRQLFERTDEGVISIAPDGEIREYNERGAEFVPALGEEITTLEELLAFFSLDALTDGVKTVAVEGESGRRRYRLTTHGLDFGPHRVGRSIFIEETTERHLRKRHVRLFERAIETTAQAVLITDQEGTITYVNPVFEAQTGYSREEAVGRTPNILSSGTHDEAFYADMWETILAGETWTDTLLNQRKSGMLYTAEMEISPITDDDGEITHFVAVSNDITAQRQRDQQLTVLNRLLRHNLRNGMNVIQGNAELLRERVVDRESRSYLDAIETRAEILAAEGQKVADIQALLSEDVSRAARYDPCPAIESLLAEFESEYPLVDFSLRCPVSTPVRADDRLGVAISELISNAVRHNERADLAVRVSVECTSVDGDADWVDIVVADTGSGIPPHEREIIESGRETPLKHTTGLGLWLVYWTVSLFGGEVSIREADGETKVHLRVLAIDDAAESADVGDTAVVGGAGVCVDADTDAT